MAAILSAVVLVTIGVGGLGIVVIVNQIRIYFKRKKTGASGVRIEMERL